MRAGRKNTSLPKRGRVYIRLPCNFISLPKSAECNGTVACGVPSSFLASTQSPENMRFNDSNAAQPEYSAPRVDLHGDLIRACNGRRPWSLVGKVEGQHAHQ